MHYSGTVTSTLKSCFSVFLLFSALGLARGDDGFDCHVSKDGHAFDLTSLSGKHTVSRTRETPPTSVTDEVVFDLCHDLSPADGVSNSEQCPEGTRVCLTKINKKENEKDRIVAVIPIAQTSKLQPEFKILTSPEPGLELTLHGGEYPLPNNESKRAQSLSLTLLCSDKTSDPSFKSYDGSTLNLEWSAPAGCENEKPPGAPSPQDPEPSNRGSGVGWFFLVLLLAFIAYFALGAYYNYANYGASGYDLIPHRDFWREVPYMLRDVVSHLCSTIRPRQSSRGGYIAV